MQKGREPIVGAKFSLRSAMIAIAIGACFPSMLGGILGRSYHEGYKLQENKYKAALLDLRRRDGVANLVTEFEREAVSAADNVRKSQEAFTNTRALVGVALISGGLAIILRLWQGPEIHSKPRPASYLFSACSTLALILLAAFILAATLCIVGTVLIISIRYMFAIYNGM